VKTEIRHICEICRYESKSYNEIFDCECNCLGLNEEEMLEYIKLRKATKEAMGRLSNERNPALLDASDRAVAAELEFERKHGLKDYAKAVADNG